MSTEEATIHPDGSSSYEEQQQQQPADPPGSDGGGASSEETFFEPPPAPPGIDPAFYLLGAVLLIAVFYYFMVYRKKKSAGSDSFFTELDGDKFNLKLPAEVDEYYDLKEKIEAAGWKPGDGAGAAAQNQPPNAPSRILAQALMKRAIADIPIVTHIQKESAGMNKLYSQSMCSVKQWRSYQAAEAMVSSEVDDVRAEADQVEPGWSQVIWRQAMQYHNMLKQKHEMEQKAAEEQAAKRKQIEQRVAEAKKIMSEEEKAKAAEKAAQELIQAEEQEKTTSGSGSGSTGGTKKKGGGPGMKKGFLDGSNKGKKKK